MSIFAVEYVYDPEQEDLRAEHRPEHRGWLEQLVEQGVVLASGPFVDGSGALLVVASGSEAELNSVLAQDPFAREGVISAVKTAAWNPIIGVFKDHV
ncbi:hypothetical protein E8P82_02570 [Arthrobacter echini]|uniref:YCII-related domain-containing protein n=1 Tax=Arthrobacter echini TaxID=1529066 RepID=A0A4S5E8A4_9MICC|nr:YciI family protein [Arthrobacter echini]THJ67740.1 hypothetical protein E8P82_02570 [Arthrobacter echini]